MKTSNSNEQYKEVPLSQYKKDLLFFKWACGVGVLGIIIFVFMIFSRVTYVKDYIAVKAADLEFLTDIKACAANQQQCLNNVILISGPFHRGDGQRFADFLASRGIQSGEGKYVCFNSPGGDVDAALQIGEKLAELKFNTCVAGSYSTSTDKPDKGMGTTVCASACPFALLGGHERVLVGFALIGIHEATNSETGAYFYPKRLVNKLLITRRLHSYAKYGVKGPAITGELDLYEEASQTHWSRMRYLVPDEVLCQFGIVTATMPKSVCCGVIGKVPASARVVTPDGLCLTPAEDMKMRVPLTAVDPKFNTGQHNDS